MTNATRIGFRLHTGVSTSNSAKGHSRKVGHKQRCTTYRDHFGWVRWTQLAADIDRGFRHFWANRVKPE